MIEIHNDYRHHSCPFCQSINNCYLGLIYYNQPLKFSTAIIQLDIAPELWQCLKCESWYVQNVIPETAAKTIYSYESSSSRWTQDRWEKIKPKNQLHCLSRYFKKSSHVLDIGCNTGELLDFARGLGCDTSGIEYSIASCDVLREKGHRVFSSIEQVDQTFDVITAFDLIEHLYDPGEFLQKCRQLLRPGGVLILLTGNIESNAAKRCMSDWWYVSYPEHIVFPSSLFFARYSEFFIRETISTYASKWYEKPFSTSLIKVIVRILRGNYKGLPSLHTDHVLLVLSKEQEGVSV